MEGLPIGNGTLGALIWTEGSRLIAALNHSELWDDAPHRGFKNWSEAQEEHQTTLRHAGRLILDFGQPLFDPWYLQDCRGRLSLGDATASLSVRTPFGGADISAYVSQDHQVLVVKGTASSAESIGRTMTLERWGSRTFAHWYAHVRRDPSFGLGGTETTIDDQRLMVTQKTRSGHFCVAAALVLDGDATVQPQRIHQRTAEFQMAPSRQIRWTLYLAVASSHEMEKGAPVEPRAHVMKLLDKAVSDGEAEIGRQHAARWHEFWSASGVHLSDDYLENLWYLHFYYLASCSQGQSPPNFINGLWGWNRDLRPWNFFFHWNMQTLYWPIHAANHAELARPYQDYRRRQLPMAREDARALFGKPGAFYADVAERRGYQDQSEHQNLTPGSQIALEFWRHYEFTGEETFLRDQAYPVLREVSRFFVALLERGEDGLWHMPSATAYEGWILLRDSITDLANGRALLAASVRAAGKLALDREEAARWREILETLAPLPVMPMPTEWTIEKDGRRVHRAGVAEGEPVAGTKILAAGRLVTDEKLVGSRLGSGAVLDGIFPEAEYAPIFPAEILGLKEKGSPWFDAAVNGVRTHGHQAPGWAPAPIVLARLGMARELAQLLADWPPRFQLYGQGFGHWIEGMRADAEQRWRTNSVKDVDSADKPAEMTSFPMSSWPTRHMALESSGVLAAGINEMLLQSHEGILRVFPAVLRESEAGFTLLARGGFLVSAWQSKGRVEWVHLESQRGGECRLESPWPGRTVFLWRLNHPSDDPESVNGAELRLATMAGEQVLLSDDSSALAAWPLRAGALPANQAPKLHPSGKARLGQPRMF